MDNYFEQYAVAVIIVFGALILGGLMVASVAFNDRDAFFFALGSSTSAWIAGHALLFDRVRIYGALVTLSILMAAASALVLAY